VHCRIALRRLLLVPRSHCFGQTIPESLQVRLQEGSLMAETGKPSSLAAWNDGAAKSQILDFVARVTEQGGPEFVPPAERIATFDNDGTLWCEQPLFVQAFFLMDRARELAG